MKVDTRLVALLGALAPLLASPGAAALDAIEVGEWKIDFSGNINGFASDVKCESPAGGGTVAGGLACGSTSGGDYDANNIRTGLLPSWLGFHAEKTDGDNKYGVMIGFQPGIDGGNQNAITGSPLDGGLGLNSENLRQVYLEWSGNWGGIKVGRDLGLFGSDAILSDMTLLGVGTVSDLTRGGGNTSLGRIGVGYIYADWKGQIQYSSPKLGGFQFNVALVDPWGLVNLSGQSLNAGATSFNQEGSTYGLEGKAAFSFGDPKEFNGKVWVSAISQEIKSAGGFGSEDALGYDVGAKVGLAGFEVVGYYYQGEGIGTTGFLFDAVDLGGNARDSDGFYAQATFKLPGIGTKIGASFGESNLDLGPADLPGSPLVSKNESIVVGIYHPLTSFLNLVAEYTQTKSTAHNGAEAKETAIAIGAILFY
ncbi:MAG TPA: porin [Steroidobacteraceae bacterium]|nr:porin [Steroidobacteraceae bacterium]